MGIFGNCISFIVFISLWRHTISWFVYLALLCIVDLLTIGILLGNQWYLCVFERDLMTEFQQLSDLTCQVFSFLSGVINFASTWILILPLIEIWIAIVSIHTSQRVCIWERTKNLLLILTLFLLFLNGHFFFTHGLVTPHFTDDQFVDFRQCMFTFVGDYDNDTFRNYVWPYTDLAVSHIVPYIVIITMCYKIHKARLEFTAILRQGRFFDSDVIESFARLCFVINILYVFIALPESCYVLFEHIREKTGSTVSYETSMVMRICSAKLKDTFRACKFFLYIVLLPRFRCRLKYLFTCGKLK